MPEQNKKRPFWLYALIIFITAFVIYLFFNLVILSK